MHARRMIQSVRNGEIQAEERRRQPYAGADTLSEVLVGQLRTVIVDRRDIEEGAHAELRDV